MEIERKFIPKCLPDNLDSYEHHDIQQAYLNTSPVIRIRKQDEDYFLTYKGSGMMSREEYNLPLNQKKLFSSFDKKPMVILLQKHDISFLYFNSLTAELDIFHDIFDGRLLVEVEFNSIEDANSFIPPEWFGEDVTYDKKYHNSNMSKEIL